MLDGFGGTERFRIERKLGSGSMGAVYLAYDRQLKARVALKALLRVDAAGIYRFKNEFRALSDVSHPNLVTLHELFSEDGQWFFTMEYVEGRDLLEHLHGTRQARHSLPPRAMHDEGDDQARPCPETLEPALAGLEQLFPTPLRDEEQLRAALLQTVSAIEAVHRAGKLHRDIKPENLLVTLSGRVVVLDFGIAIERKRDVHQTIGSVMGTPAYMAPEQFLGETSEASDWYSLGTVLYEALTGDVPFDGAPSQIMRTKQELDPTPPNEVVADVPDDLNDLCMHLLRRDPRERATGQSVRDTLSGWQPTAIRPKGEREEARSRFVGREGQLADLEAALSATDENEPVVTLVEGPSGIGKTTLIKEFVRRVTEQDRAVVLTGRCYERESLPFKAFDNIIDTLSRYLRRLPAVEAAAMLPRDVEALTGLFPVLSRVDVVRQQRRRRPLPPDPRQLRGRAFRALSEMLCRIADHKPLLCFIDDLQWSDSDSTRLLNYLLTSNERPAMLLICAFRLGPTTDRSAAAHWLAQLGSTANLQVRTLPVGVLSAESTYELASRLLGPDMDEGARRIALESGGNPQLLSELVRHVVERRKEGRASPDTARGLVAFDHVLSQRIEQLSTGARTLLELLAVSARPVPEPLLTLVGSFNIDLPQALSELRAAKLIRGITAHDMRAVEVYHDTIREAVTRSLDPPRLTLWHRRLAAALEASGAVDLEALTEHLVGAGELERAGVYAARAAAQALAALAFDKAARLYRLAAAQAPRAERLEHLEAAGHALVSAGRGLDAAETFFEAARGAPDTQADRLHMRAGIQLLHTGRHAEAMAALSAPLASMGIVLQFDQATCIAEAVEQATALQARGYAFSEQPLSAIDEPARLRLETLDGILTGLSVYNFHQPTHLSPSYLSQALAAGHAPTVVRALCWFELFCGGVLRAQTGQPQAGALDVAEALSQRLAEPEAAAVVNLCRALSHFLEGRAGDALPLLQRAEEVFRSQCTGSVHETRMTRLSLAHVFLAQAQFDAFPLFDEWIAEAEDTDDAVTATRLRMVRCASGLLEDRAAQSLLELREAMEAGDDVDSQLHRHTFAQVEAAHLVYLRDRDGCRAAMYRCDDLLSTLVGLTPIYRGETLMRRARLGLALGGGHDAPASLLERIAADLSQVEVLDLPCLESQLCLLRAALCMFDGKRVDAAVHCLAPLLSSDNELRAAVALYATGLLLGNAAQVRAGDLSLRQLGIENPGAFTHLCAPGING